jgi:phenylpyruvate tautomerase PptA (4-oxalocrotonate tautomerase family)
MPRITIEWFNTRTDEQRQEIARRITEVMVEVAKVRPQDVAIRFDEIDPRFFARGGVIHGLQEP